jgi:GntR family transcriptional regulator, transcriptional repressor for pyruvate dehydrogenase complex
MLKYLSQYSARLQHRRTLACLLQWDPLTVLGIGPEARRRISAPRIAEIVADELRRQIINGELADGDLLPRQEILVEQFDVSLVSLREALRILATEGLLSVRRGNRGGAVVHAPAKTSAAYMLGLLLQSDHVQLPDLGNALLELEPTCAALAARRPDRADSVVPSLREVNDAMAEHILDGARFTEFGRKFHHRIIRGCGNQTMIAVVGSLEALWSAHEQKWAEEADAKGEYPSLKDRQSVLTVHIRLTEAVESGDADRARRLASKHAEDAQTYVLSEDQDLRIVAYPPQALSARSAER